MSYSLPFLPIKLLKAPDNKQKLKQLQYEISLCKTLLTNMRVAVIENISKLYAFEAFPELNPEYLKLIQEIKDLIPSSFYGKAMDRIDNVKQPEASIKVT
jgi:hypothetical protein